MSWKPIHLICATCSVVSDSLHPHGLQPTSLICLWNFPGKNTGVGAISSRAPSQPRDPTRIWQADSFPSSSDGKASACNAGDLGSVPGSGRSPGKGNGYPLQYPCLKNPMDRAAWPCGPWGHPESDVMEQLVHIATCLYPLSWTCFRQAVPKVQGK